MAPVRDRSFGSSSPTASESLIGLVLLLCPMIERSRKPSRLSADPPATEAPDPSACSSSTPDPGSESPGVCPASHCGMVLLAWRACLLYTSPSPRDGLLI